jgi:ribosomal protein L7Ae-like RNA K-turn-binding protein
VNDLSGPLGLCIRARACSYGFENALKMMRKNKSFLVFISQDASDATKKRMMDKCNHYNVEYVVMDMRETYKKLNIKESIKIISINNLNFKKLIDKRLKGET